ncbi:MAG: trehalose utilization protein ThuA [Clostridiales bacterium]|nr:trehalose utilization protein ThuA [Clostridiales bacterium]
MTHVLVWYENRPLPEAVEEERRVYPRGVHGALLELFQTQADLQVRTATLQDAEQGLGDEALAWADVLVYFSHKHWREVADERVDAAQRRVLDGMGLVLLHSSHASKLFSRMMGTRTQCLRWREGRTTAAQRAAGAVAPVNDGEWQRVWLVAPSHPIAQGLDGESFLIPKDESYGEYFEIPQPEEQVFLTTSEGGEVLRSGCCWRRGMGKIFYFASGHETFPVYYQPEIRTVLLNAVRWAAPSRRPAGWPDWARETRREEGNPPPVVGRG